MRRRPRITPLIKERLAWTAPSTRWMRLASSTPAVHALPRKLTRSAILDVVTATGSVRLGLLLYTFGFNGIPYPSGEAWRSNLIDEQRILTDSHLARQQGAEVVVVALHWGRSSTRTPTTSNWPSAQVCSRHPTSTSFSGTTHMSGSPSSRSTASGWCTGSATSSPLTPRQVSRYAKGCSSGSASPSSLTGASALLQPGTRRCSSRTPIPREFSTSRTPCGRPIRPRRWNGCRTHGSHDCRGRQPGRDRRWIGAALDALVAGRTVDTFAQQVGVSVVACVLRDRRDEDAPQRDRLAGGLPDAGLIQ